MKIFGIILCGNDELSTEVLKSGALDGYFSFLGHEKIEVATVVFLNISNIFEAGQEEFISLFANNPIYLEKLMYLMNVGLIDETVLFI